ncbi:MAG: hypothetical protein RL727_1148, partial [Pseudomonadota bacterium]
MNYSYECSVCGNARPVTGECPFCNTLIAPLAHSDTDVINLELDGPTSEEALDQLTHYIRAASEAQIRALVVIHGYGSSGKGGNIRKKVREALEHNFFADRVSEYYHGEDLRHQSDLYRDVIK